MLDLAFINIDTIYLKSESEKIHRVKIDKEIEESICDMRLYYRDGTEEVKKIVFDFSCFVTFSCDNEYLFVASGEKRYIMCYRLNDMSVKWKIKIREDVGQIYYCAGKLYCDLWRGIQVFNAENGKFLEKLRATCGLSLFTLGNEYLCMSFAEELRVYDMKNDKYVYKNKNHFRLEDGYVYMQVTAQAEETTTAKFGYGRVENSYDEGPTKEITFKISDFIN